MLKLCCIIPVVVLFAFQVPPSWKRGGSPARRHCDRKPSSPSLPRQARQGDLCDLGPGGPRHDASCAQDASDQESVSLTLCCVTHRNTIVTIQLVFFPHINTKHYSHTATQRTDRVSVRVVCHTPQHNLDNTVLVPITHCNTK